MATNQTKAAAAIRSLRGKYKHLPLLQTLMKMRRKEKKLEDAKFRRCNNSR